MKKPRVDVWKPLGGEKYLRYVLGARFFTGWASLRPYRDGLSTYSGICWVGWRILTVTRVVEDLGEWLPPSSYILPRRIFSSTWIIKVRNHPFDKGLAIDVSDPGGVAAAVERLLGCDLMLSQSHEA